MFFQQFLGELVVALAQRAVADHVGEHDGGKLALFSHDARVVWHAGNLLLLVLAKFLEARIIPQRIEHRIEPEQRG